MINTSNVDTTASNQRAAFKHSSETWKMFDVPTDVFRRFETGRNKFERWSKYLNLEDESQAALYNYAKKNPSNTIVLRDSANGVLRQIRRRSAL
jgi:hypothetical protein